MKKSLLIIILLVFVSLSSNSQTISLSQLISIHKMNDLNYSDKYLKDRGWVSSSSNDDGINYANKYGDIIIISLYEGLATRATFTSAELRDSYFKQIKNSGGVLRDMTRYGDVSDMNYKGELFDFIFSIKLLPKNKQIYTVTVCKLK